MIRINSKKRKEIIYFFLSTTIPSEIICCILRILMLDNQIFDDKEWRWINLIITTISAAVIFYAYRNMLKSEISRLIKKKRLFYYIPLYFLFEIIASIRISIKPGINDVKNENSKILGRYITIAPWPMFIIIVFLGPFMEEFWFRFFLFKKIRGKKSIRKSISTADYWSLFRNCCVLFFSSVIFGYLHVIRDFSIERIMPYFLSGVFFGLIYDFSGLLSLSILAHSLWNFFIFLIIIILRKIYES